MTEDFSNLNIGDKKCQHSQSFESCMTNLYLNDVVDECNCIPYALKNFSNPQSKVNIFRKRWNNFTYLMICFRDSALLKETNVPEASRLTRNPAWFHVREYLLMFRDMSLMALMPSLQNCLKENIIYIKVSLKRTKVTSTEILSTCTMYHVDLSLH